MSEKKKQKMAYLWAILTLLATCLVGGLVSNFSDQVLPIFLGSAALLFGPVTGVLYLIEVKRGVFRVEEDEQK